MASTVSGYIGQINPGDGTNYAIGSTAYGVCTTSPGTGAKTVDMTGFALTTGATIHVKFKSGNTATSNLTLNVNGTGAKSIIYGLEQDQFGYVYDIRPFILAKGQVVSFTYFDNAWVINTGCDTAYNNVGSYVECSTGASTAAKTVSLTGFRLTTGATLHVKFAYTNTATNPTLTLNSGLAKAIYLYGSTRVGTTEATSWKAGQVVSFTYNGSYWFMNDYQEGGGLPSGGSSHDLLVKSGESAGWLSPANAVLVHKTIIFQLYDQDYNLVYQDNPTGPFGMSYYIISGEGSSFGGAMSEGIYVPDLYFDYTAMYQDYRMDNIFLDYGVFNGDYQNSSDGVNICERYKCTFLSLGEFVTSSDDDYDSSWMDEQIQGDNSIYRLKMRFSTVSEYNGKKVLKVIDFKTFYNDGGYEFTDVATGSYYRTFTYSAEQCFTETKVISSSPISSLPTSISDSWVTSDTIVARLELYDPSVQVDTWSVTTQPGTISISGTIKSGDSTTIKLTLLKPV